MFETLKAEIGALAGRYIEKYIPADPEQGPEQFEYDVKAFSLMAHAAFEEFCEWVSEAVMAQIVGDVLAMRISISTACFLMAYDQKILISESEDEEQDSCFTFIRKGLDEAKRLHSNTLMNNHGFSIKYLRKILTPVGINIPDGPERGSLRILADARGSFAHSMAKSAKYGEYRKAQKILTPEAAQGAVSDCLNICERIKDQAKLLFP